MSSCKSLPSLRSSIATPQNPSKQEVEAILGFNLPKE
jgi:hypothetical protein